jgi:hypothetical protein
VTVSAPQRPLDASGRPRGRCRVCRRSCALTGRGLAWWHRPRFAVAYPPSEYLLHFDAPFGHARHYTGWASDLYGRLAHHGGPGGANLLQHVAKAGIGWQLARTWDGDRYLERRLKRRGGATRRCPICCPDLAERLLASSIG